ncbi:MAG: ribosome-associated translation inhibitor RaiA [Burkholderiaceae bacterium]|nr:ribosome-associated translation inhibitor RaiA [Burkholderiaceae bacterium]
MHLTVKGHHIEITSAIRHYVDQKFGRTWRHFDHVNEVHVVLGVEKLNQIAEVTVHLPGKDIHCEASHADLYAAIDLLADKLDRQVVRYKETHRPGVHRGQAAGHQMAP